MEVFLWCLSDLRRRLSRVSVQNGMPNSPEMHWSKNLESVRKDIEGVFGILKICLFLEELQQSSRTIVDRRRLHHLLYAAQHDVAERR
jgi:hypothetical protein